MLTYHTIVTKNNFDTNIEDFQALCENYNRAKYKAFALICKNNNLIKNDKNKKNILELTPKEKSQLAIDYNLTGRYVNSLNHELKGIVSSYLESQKTFLENKTQLFNSMMDEKEKLTKILNNFDNDFSMIFTKYKITKILNL